MFKRTITAATLAGVALVGSQAHADPKFPEKPVTVIIGFAPGGSTDAIGRVLLRKMGEDLHTTMVVENRPGAGGNTGAQALLRAKPDGYTLLYASASMAIAPALFNRSDLNPTTAFATAGCAVGLPMVLLVSSSVSVNNAADFYKLIQSNPGKYFQGTSGNGAMDQLAMIDIANTMGLKYQQVPYNGNGPAVMDLAAGNTQFMLSASFNSALPFISSGKLKALAVTSLERSAAVPGVPSLSESVPALKGFEAGTWQALIAPKGTPAEILNKLDQAMQKAMADPTVQTSLRFQGAEPMRKNPKQCQDYIAAEYGRWSETIMKGNVKVN